VLGVEPRALGYLHAWQVLYYGLYPTPLKLLFLLLQYWGLNSGPTPEPLFQPFFCEGYFFFFCRGWRG
jgi:hypothetical protein